MAAAFALSVLRAPINAVTSVTGRVASASCGNASYQTLQVSPELEALEAMAPDADRGRVLLFFHGGGHWLLNPETYREFIGRLSDTTGCCVVAVAYRKPPQVRFPAGLEDCLATFHWAQEHYPGASVALSGDSSGADLAFAMLVKLAQLDAAMPSACVGISPWLQLDLSDTFANAYGRWCVDLYLGGDDAVTTPKDPLVSPVYAGVELVRKFPPILMHAGEDELTTGDVKLMSQLLHKAGMSPEVEFYCAPHIFQVSPGFPQATQDSMAKIAAFLAKHCPGTR